MDRGTALAQDAKEAPEGFYEYQRWIAGPEAQPAKDAIDAKIRSRFGKDSKTERFVTLSAGLIGVVLDHRAQQVVTVVDPKRVDVAALDADLRDTAAAEHRRNPDVAELRVRVQAGCFPAADLVDAGKQIEAREWDPAAKEVSHSGAFEARDSTYHVRFNIKDQEVAEALRTRLGPLVTIEYAKEDPELDKYRNNDTEPHWGGAKIASSAHTCTSGFAVDTQSAGKAMVTAGHCFGNGSTITSGTGAYGTSQGEYDYPDFDMMLLNGNVNYDDDLFHAASAIANESTPLDVASGTDPTTTDTLCISGAFTGNVCGMDVNTVNGAFMCVGGNCTYGLTETERTGVFSCQGGDSGAPVYESLSSTSAAIRGMHVGRPGDSHDICYSETVNSIEAHLHVTIATSP